MKITVSYCLRSCWCIALVFLWGCGGDSSVGYVSGKVTLDGAPLSGARITFAPTKDGSPSAAVSDAEGNYELIYTSSTKGAIIGEHLVKVMTYQQADPDAEPPREAVPEKIPLKYNYQSELKKEVKGGSNTIDLELKTDGPVVQPDVLNKMNKD